MVPQLEGVVLANGQWLDSRFTAAFMAIVDAPDIALAAQASDVQRK